MPRSVETSSHWGTYLVDVDEDGRVRGARPHADDPDAAPSIANVADAQHARSRVARPAVRRRWLEGGPGPDDQRGAPDDEYVEVDWRTALDLLPAELDRVRTTFGNEAVFGGVVLTDAVLPGVAQMHTGAWYDPSAPEVADCVNGNVNVLTRDVGTSSLTQGCSGAHVLVAVERHDGPLPPVRAYDPPRLSPEARLSRRHPPSPEPPHEG